MKLLRGVRRFFRNVGRELGESGRQRRLEKLNELLDGIREAAKPIVENLQCIPTLSIEDYTHIQGIRDARRAFGRSGYYILVRGQETKLYPEGEIIAKLKITASGSVFLNERSCGEVKKRFPLNHCADPNEIKRRADELVEKIVVSIQPKVTMRPIGSVEAPAACAPVRS